jgi:lipid-A-disaccharide synthase
VLLVCAGDPSGDSIAARAVEAWRRIHPGEAVEGFGGPALASTGLSTLRVPLLRWPFPSPTGIVEPLRAVPSLLACAGAMLARASRRDATAALLVDLPEFNLPLGRLLRRLGVPVVQAVAPQTWAWRPGRNTSLRDSCDVLAVILPFEEPYFRAVGIDARFVGHPLVERLGPLTPPPVPAAEQALRLALLPGSRPERVRHVLPALLAGAAEVARRGLLSAVTVSRAPTVERVLVDRCLRDARLPLPVDIEERPPLDWLCSPSTLSTVDCRLSTAFPQVWVSAGTGSLEVAALGIPACVAFRTGWIGWAAARRLVHGRFAGLPNRLLEREALPERIQDGLTPSALAETFDELRRPESFARAAAAALELRKLLGEAGFAERVARVLDEVAR